MEVVVVTYSGQRTKFITIIGCSLFLSVFRCCDVVSFCSSRCFICTNDLSQSNFTPLVMSFTGDINQVYARTMWHNCIARTRKISKLTSFYGTFMRLIKNLSDRRNLLTLCKNINSLTIILMTRKFKSKCIASESVFSTVLFLPITHLHQKDFKLLQCS